MVSHQPGPDELITTDATVDRALFTSPDTGWCVLRCRSDHGASFTAVGPLLGVREGDELRLTGRWVQHPRFGEQLEVVTHMVVVPTTEDGIRRFLASGRLKGIGPKLAERIVAAFGLDSLDVIEHHPGRLLEVRGVGRKTLERIQRSWGAHRGIQQILVFLASHGVSPGVAAKVHARYGAAALEVVRSNPYRLADEVFGVGFRTADRIARRLGIPDDAPERLEAGILYVIQEATGDGHVFLPRDQVVATAAELLGAASEPTQLAVARLTEQGKVVVRPREAGEHAVYPVELEAAEATVAERVRGVVSAATDPASIDVSRALEWYQQRAGIRLAELQREALQSALVEPATVITGGPGTGKTTLIRGIIQILARKDRRVLLAAPTGRAAKRLQETTGEEARTIHRLLEFNPRTRAFGRNADHPLEADLVVVDELSMLDVVLAAHLLRALPAGCRLALVGDADQLPSVGPGNVLGDLIASGAIKVVRLRDIFRQAERSLIVVNAHRINRGEMPFFEARDEDGDFFFIHREHPVEAADLAIELATERIPRKFGLDPVDDIQVLTPMHRGELGVTRLNQRLQSILTPSGPELTVGARSYRLGDKVMQLRNNYDLDIYNGDLGRITTVDADDRVLAVSFDGRPVVIESDDLEDLTPAYACTIHKAQGSEYPAVVVLMHHSHHVMLQRNLLYTAVTRGRRLVVIVGSRRALGRAVRNATVRQRYTMLADRLRAAGHQAPRR